MFALSVVEGRLLQTKFIVQMSFDFAAQKAALLRSGRKMETLWKLLS